MIVKNILIQKLPNEVVFKIIQYTYHFQNKNLLVDIIDFVESKKTILKMYYDNQIIYMGEESPQDKCWLINDIFAFTNNYHALIYGYTNKFYNIIRRNGISKTQEEIMDFIICLENKELDTQINVLWGLLNPIERKEFITMNNNIIEELDL